MYIFASYRSILNFTTTSILILLLCVLGAVEVKAQFSQTAGTTPSLLTPGTPVGTYPLEGFDTVNIFNGNLNFSLPILTIKGRGSVSHTINLRIEQRWQVDKTQAAFGVYTPMAHWWTGIEPGYGPGTIEGRSVNDPCGDGGNYAGNQMTRLYFTAPDGTEIEFRDQESRGAVKLGNCYPQGIYGPLFNRKKIFNAVDGSAATFISDTDIYDWNGVGDNLIFPTGNLMWRDGTMYRMVNGVVVWMRDRNGNRLEGFTDSLNRQVTITTHPQGVSYYHQFDFRGSNGAPRQIKIWYRPLEEVLRDDFRTGSQPYTKTYAELFGMGSSQTAHNPLRAASVELPDGRSYQFFYNLYGELARVVLPTGGAYEYDWVGGVNGEQDIVRRVSEKRIYPNGGQGSGFSVRTVFTDNQTPLDPNNSWFITEQRDPGNNLLAHGRHHHHGNVSNSTLRTPFENIPFNEGREHKTELFNTSGSSPTNLLRELRQVWTASFWGAAPPSDTRVIEKITTLADASPTLVSKEVYTYGSYNNVTRVDEYGYGSGSPGSLVRYRQTQYLTNTYDTNLNIHLRGLPTQEQVFDAGGALRAQTNYEYDNYTPDTGTLHDELKERSGISGLCDGSAQNCPNGPNFTVKDYKNRGNVTKVSRWLNTGGAVDTYQQYDVAGNVVKAIDAKGSAIIFDFGDRFGSPDDDARQNTPPTNPNWLNGQTTFAFVTKVTNALGHEAYTQYDYFLGAPVNSEDANGIVSSLAYNDALDRPTQGIQARYKVGSGVTSARRQTTFAYDDVNRRITTTGDRDTFNDNILTSKSYYDGLGRTWRRAGYEGNTGGGNTWLITDTQFDALGRTWKVSNPFRLTAPDGAPGSVEWTTTDYDALSRVIKVATPDTAEVKTAYSGNRVMASDQAGKKRLSEINALGNLVKVWEITSPDPGETQITFTGSTTSDLNGTYNVNLTSYSYDTLNNLLQVAQGSQRRWFAYDSLSRLIRARNSEQATYNFTFNPPQSTVTVTVGAESNSNWSMAYVYDPNGNLLKKKSVTGPSATPAEIETSYLYDALNRNTQTAYSSYPNGSFYVDWFYDGATNGKGRFWYDIANNYRWEKPTDNLAYHHNKVNSYDALGRPLNQEQNFLVLEGGSWQYKPFSLSRTYDLAGNVKTQNYPSGRTVNYGYDTAGRLNSFTGNLGGGAPVNYATGIKYNDYGLMTRETYGTQTPLYFNLHYNNRLQIVDLRLGSNSSDEYDWSRGALIFYYGTNARNLWNPFANSLDNNGNVLRHVNYAPLAGGGSVVPQLDDYNYDPLNRITSVNEQQQNQSGQWTSVFTQAFNYDRWGNRTINVGATTSGVAGVTRKNFVVDTATNRMTSSDGCGMTYDAAGNQTYDCVGTHSYDSENRMTKAAQGSSNNYYFYDANGKRVRRILNGSQTWGGQETWFVYGFDGELVAEYTYNQVTAPLLGAPQKEYGYRNGKMLVVWDGSQAGDDALKWMVTDHLGSTRMEANKSGSLAGIRRHDYLPFGEELVASTGAQRSLSGMGYEPPASNVKQKFTNKERDSETGLDYFGFRYFSSTQGRFTSPDAPFADQHIESPQSWNLYAYARGNPLIYTDTDGRWLKHVHEQIIDNFFKQWSKQDRQILRDASKWLDSKEGGAFDTNNAYMHSLAAPGQGAYAAAGKAKEWIEGLRTRFQKATNKKDELWVFGLALHTVMDNTSPSHEGFQTWNPISKRPLDALGHALGESDLGGILWDTYRYGMTLGAAYEITSYFYGEKAAVSTYGTQLGSTTDANVRTLMGFYSTRGPSTEALQAEAVHVFRIGISQGRARTRKLLEGKPSANGGTSDQW